VESKELIKFGLFLILGVGMFYWLVRLENDSEIKKIIQKEIAAAPDYQVNKDYIDSVFLEAHDSVIDSAFQGNFSWHDPENFNRRDYIKNLFTHMINRAQADGKDGISRDFQQLEMIMNTKMEEKNFRQNRVHLR
jgi:hypothetical protein